MKKYFAILIVYTVVIVNPYEGLDYERINAYYFNQEYYEVIETNPEPNEEQLKPEFVDYDEDDTSYQFELDF